MALRVSKDQFAELVEQALAELPYQFANFLEEVRLEIADRPTPEQLRLARVKQNGLLLGLYQGRPRTARSVWDSGQLPDVIWIFQQPIEEICRSQEQLVRQVRTTVLHEIGHHFGMTEDDLTRLGYG
jgi:predicted Zn-dependent protease with MMP-like domain